MENDDIKNQFSRRGFLGIGSVALAAAGGLAVSSAMAQVTLPFPITWMPRAHIWTTRACWMRRAPILIKRWPIFKMR